MDPAWTAVLGTAIGATGATVAATITGWSARRQSRVQHANDQSQWRREKRRDTYSAFLDAGVQARDELTAIWRLLKAADCDTAQVARRLANVDSLVKAVRRASATNFIEGPGPILEPTRRAEESIVLFEALLNGALTDSTGKHLRMCTRQEAYVRGILDRFAAAAREVLEGVEQRHELLVLPPARDSSDELTWLVATIAKALETTPAEINVTRPVVESGLDSLSLLFVFRQADDELNMPHDHIWPLSSLLFTASIKEVAEYIAATRRTHS